MATDQVVVFQSFADTYAFTESPDESLSFAYNPSSPGAHRFWRLWITQTGDNYAAFAEIELHSTVGGPDLTVPGGAVTASGSEATNPVANSIDNNAATQWSSWNTAVPLFWRYDFGPGNAVEIVEVKITSRNDTWYNEAPGKFSVQYSDDGTNWYTAWTVSATWTSGGQTQSFPASAGGFATYFTGLFMGEVLKDVAASPWNIASLVDQGTPPPAGTGGNACF